VFLKDPLRPLDEPIRPHTLQIADGSCGPKTTMDRHSRSKPSYRSWQRSSEPASRTLLGGEPSASITTIARGRRANTRPSCTSEEASTWRDESAGMTCKRPLRLRLWPADRGPGLPVGDREGHERVGMLYWRGFGAKAQESRILLQFARGVF
jgi:hypothetical protein